MSEYSIKCPKCGAEQTVPLFDSINIAENSELRDQLLANQLNAVTCGECEFMFRVDKRLLYNDPERRFMIYWFPGDVSDYRRNKDDFMASMDALNGVLPEGFEPPAVHLVFNRAELVERIFLLEAELNERVIEYIKYMMYSKNLEKLDPKNKMILFNAEDSTEGALCFVMQDMQTMKLEGMLEFDRTAYEGLLDMFDEDDKTASLMELFPGPYISARELFLQDAAEA